MAARAAKSGLFLMEVFPAIAMPTFSNEFYGRLKAPKYNPATEEDLSDRRLDGQ